MKKHTIIIIVGIICFGALLWLILTYQGVNKYFTFTSNSPLLESKQKIYVANEGESTLSVIHTDNALVTSINLSQTYYGKLLSYSAHNVQVSPKGDLVLVTANSMEQGESHGSNMVDNDALFLIDPLRDVIVGRIDLGIGLHLAHVVVNVDSTFAYIVSQEKNELLVIDLTQKEVIKKIPLPEGSQPHGLRLSPDGDNLYIALIEGKAMAIMNVHTFVVDIVPLGAKAIQVAILPNNRYVFVSLYDTKNIARYDTQTHELRMISLGTGSYGPVQIYPSPNNASLIVADQGYYFGQKTGTYIYQINAQTLAIDHIYTGGAGPHGVVINPTGNKAYVTNLLSDTVTVLDIKNYTILQTIHVGKKPNGISIWTKDIGGTP